MTKRRAALLVSLLAAGCASPGVARVIGGNESVGRRIDARAYAAYAEGADAEARGDEATALRAFEVALREDRASPEIWTRVGALRCKSDPVGARAAFDEARDLDPAYQPLAHEEARCAFEQGRLDAAIASAARAVALDPDRVESATLHASILERAGRSEEARRALLGLVARAPSSRDAWRATQLFATRAGDLELAARAAHRLEALGDRPPRPTGADALAAVDELLARGEDERARRDARAARLSTAEIAVRAAAFGRVALARAQAELVLGADPRDAAAQIALAVAADLTRDPDALGAALDAIGPRPSTPSPLASALFAELLLRRAGLEAARAFLDAQSADGLASDPLASRVADRVRARLARP